MTIQVILSVGGENGILVKNYLKIPISPLWSISSKIPKTPLKTERFKIQKIEVEKMVWLFQVEKMGSPMLVKYVIYLAKKYVYQHTCLSPINIFHQHPSPVQNWKVSIGDSNLECKHFQFGTSKSFSHLYACHNISLYRYSKHCELWKVKSWAYQANKSIGVFADKNSDVVLSPSESEFTSFCKNW